METDAELLARHNHVQALYGTACESTERTKSPGARMDKARTAGCYNFTLLGIESEMRDRNLTELRHGSYQPTT